MTLDCLRPMQFSVIIDHLAQRWSEMFFFHLPKYLFVIIVIHSYFIYISQGSVKTHLRCAGIYMYNNHIIAHFLQSVPATEFWKLVNICRRYGQK